MNIKKMVLLSLFFCAIAKAQVNPENGNFYISYHSAEQVKNDHALALVRTYNSLSPGKGWYGWGWGSPFETKLIVMPDHSAAILENEAGMVHYYHASSEDVLKGVNIIVDVVQKKDDLTNGTAEQLRGRLLRDEDFRVEMVEKFDIHAELPINASLSLNGEPLLRRIESGYDRKSSTSDEVDLFDLQGNLIEIRHDDGYDVKLDYADNKPILLHDSEGQSIKLVWSDDGHLIAAGKLDDVTESYAYDEQGELARVSDRSGNVYRYEYDQYHSMTKISYIDGSFKAIQYANDAPGRAIEVTERNGDKMLYAYSVDRSDPERTSTVETQASKDGVKTTSEYRFTHKTADNGEHILSKYSSDRNKDLDDRTYDEKGRVTSKLTASGDTIYYFYAPQTNKFQLIISGRQDFVLRFDEKGELKNILKPGKMNMDVAYAINAKGKKYITSISEIVKNPNVRHRLKFHYNKNEELYRITVVGFGSLKTDNGKNIIGGSTRKNARLAAVITGVMLDLVNETGKANLLDNNNLWQF